MGCSISSSKNKGSLQKGVSSSGSSGFLGGPGEHGLLTDYVLGDVVGQGAFGIVYAAAPKGSTDFSLAVKMVDKVDSPIADIVREANMLKNLKHPNIVGFHKLYYETCFVCILMDRYSGGDLIEGMQMYWKNKGRIPCTKALRLVKQMASAIHHLHTKIVVHRDIKGDNFLIDRPDILEEDCKVILTDFGAAAALTSPSERLKSACGTKIYWAPEFFNKDYGLKVDIWAFGVIFYGLVEGRFPFKGEADVRKKVIKLHTPVPPPCEDFLQQLLERNEAERPDSKAVMDHAWLKTRVTKDNGDDFKPTSDGTFVAENVRQQEVNGAQEERRMELIERLENQQGKQTRQMADLAVLWSSRFEVTEKRKNKTMRFEWWSQEKAEALIGEGTETTSAAQEDATDVDMINKMLREHKIDSAKFGVEKAKTLEEFVKEVNTGSSLLMLDASSHKKLVRVVDVVLLRITAGDDYLIEHAETFSDGRQRDDLNRLPGTKRDPHENKKTCAARIAATLLGLQSGQLTYEFDKQEVFEEEEESRSYPGVRTVYRKVIIPCHATAEKKAAGSFSFSDAKSNTKSFKWLSEAECTKLTIKLRAPLVGDEVSALVMPPIGFTLDELRRFLVNNAIDPEIYGKGKAKTLTEFSNELTKGESSLRVQQDGSVARLVDVVMLFLMKAGSNKVLVEEQEKLADGTVNRLERLPGARRRPDEHMFTAAQNLLRRQLQIDENHITIPSTKTRVVERSSESSVYPGIKTIYRKRIIAAELNKPDE